MLFYFIVVQVKHVGYCASACLWITQRFSSIFLLGGAITTLLLCGLCTTRRRDWKHTGWLAGWPQRPCRWCGWTSPSASAAVEHARCMAASRDDQSREIKYCCGYKPRFYFSIYPKNWKTCPQTMSCIQTTYVLCILETGCGSIVKVQYLSNS